jgi:hypothetical protein
VQRATLHLSVYYYQLIHLVKEQPVAKTGQKHPSSLPVAWPKGPSVRLLEAILLPKGFSLKVMVELSGIEPLTSCVQGRRSPS